MSDKGPVPVRTGSALEPRLSGVIGGGALVAFVFGLATFVPVLAPFAFVSPLPLPILRVRGGGASAALASVLAVALLAAAKVPALYLLVALGLPVLLLGESLARGRGLLRGCGWAFAFLVLEVALALVFAGDVIRDQTLQPIDELRSEEFLSELRASGLPEERITEFAEQTERAGDVLEVVFPAVWIIGAAIVVLMNAALLRLYLLRRDPGWLEDGEFERVRFPLALVPVFILAGGGVLLPATQPAAYNVLLVVGFFFALQGLAVVGFYARRLAAPPILRLALLVLVLANPWAPQILALVGLFDNWFVFRRWAEPPPADG